MPSDVIGADQPDSSPPAPPSVGDHAPASDGWREIEALVNAVRVLHHREQRGELANLRRMDPEKLTEPAFMRLLGEVDPFASRERVQRLALLAKILALPTSAEALARGRQNLGEALRAADVSERRVETLMTARGAALDDLLLRTARRLVHEGLLPYRDIGKLILGGSTVVEDIRFKVARAYWTGGGTRKADESAPAAIPAIPESVSGDDE